MMRVFKKLLFSLALMAIGGNALAQMAATPPALAWGFRGPFGHYDLAAARRGYQVYAESCAACHSLQWLHYRDLTGIGLAQSDIEALTAKITLPGGTGADGKPMLIPATPASVFASPFGSEDAARAALNGALPPDLSLAANAFPNGPDYIAALLTGYRDAPAGVKLADGMNYNLYFPGHQIAMPPPLAEGQIVYGDGTVSTVAQNASDVAVFLAWAANPEMAQRKHLGFRAVGYFLAMAGVAYLFQRRIWAKVK